MISSFSGRMTSLMAVLASGILLVAAGSSCTSAEIEEESLRKLAVANNHLALNVYREFSAASSENIFFSPLSLSTAFGMLFHGVRGRAAEELRAVLGYKEAGLADGQVHSTFHRFLTVELGKAAADAYVLNAANAILVDKRMGLLPTYKSQVQDMYQASVRDVDFVADAAQTLEDINSWVKDKTNGKITKLLDELGPSTVLVLLNAVYFKGTWQTQFEKEKTYLQTFYNGGVDSGAKQVSMMHLTTHFPYTAVYDVQALELPYKGENISMVVLLPNDRNGLEALEKSLTLEKLSTIRRQLSKTKVIVSMPKFKLEYSREVSGDFKSLGAGRIFSPGADFSGMTSDDNVFVSQVVHKTFVEVNEEGSEAAAVTGIVSIRIRPIMDFTPEFVADHPFLLAIVDKRSDMILFVGRVNNL